MMEFPITDNTEGTRAGLYADFAAISRNNHAGGAKKFLSEVHARFDSYLGASQAYLHKNSITSISRSVPTKRQEDSPRPGVSNHLNLKIIFSLPKVEGDPQDEMDECNYERELKIKHLKNEAKRLSKIEGVFSCPKNLEDKQRVRKDKIKKTSLYRKSRSVLPPVGILKKSDTFAKGGTKKVQFNSKKTVFRYNPHK